MFADKVEIEIKAGKGGDGRLSFRHEKFREKGGPDGGDGGRGGNVIFAVDHNSSTLSHYRTARLLKAENGAAGGANRRKGKSGKDVIVPVPPGTLVKEGEHVLADLTTHHHEQVLAHGGRGGFGNAHFTASARQSPRLAELGEPGESRKLTLELKLVADVGLAGLPNAGKSTLLSVVSNAKPEIGDYPFTTLVPNLGVVDIDDTSILMADIPGLIAGASQGKGLGDDFLRHIERTAVLLHLVDATSSDVAGDWQTVQQELRDYQVDLTAKPTIAVLTKIDAVDEATLKQRLKALKAVCKQTPLAISAPAGTGVKELLRRTLQLVQAERQASPDELDELPVIDLSTQPDVWRVSEDGAGRWRVEGARIEGFGRRTDWENPDALERLRDIMRKVGVARELRRLGAEPGDTIVVGSNELEWQ